MNEQIIFLKQFLKDNQESLSSKEIEILEYQISYLAECHEKFSKAMLQLESDPEKLASLKSDIQKIKGVINV